MQTDENIKRNSIYHTQRIHILQNEYIHLHIRIHIVFVCAWHKFVAENYYTWNDARSTKFRNKIQLEIQ